MLMNRATLPKGWGQPWESFRQDQIRLYRYVCLGCKSLKNGFPARLQGRIRCYQETLSTPQCLIRAGALGEAAEWNSQYASVLCNSSLGSQKGATQKQSLLVNCAPGDLAV